MLQSLLQSFVAVVQCVDVPARTKTIHCFIVAVADWPVVFVS